MAKDDQTVKRAVPHHDSQVGDVARVTDIITARWKERVEHNKRRLEDLRRYIRSNPPGRFGESRL